MKNKYLLVLILVLFVNSVISQNSKQKLPELKYEFNNKNLTKEIDSFIKKYNQDYKNNDRVVWLSISFDKKSFSSIIKIRYKTDFNFYDLEKKVINFHHPDIVKKYKGEYVFINLGYTNMISINHKTLFEIGKICFPEQYKLYLKNIIRINGSHQQPVIELRFKNGQLISKREYKE